MRSSALLQTGLSLAILGLVACGGGGGGGAGNTKTVTVSPPETNTMPIVVDAGPSVNGQQLGVVNLPYVSVTICTPGTSQCQTIDHVLVDTGSTGLRIMASVLSPSLSLPSATEGSNAVLECVQFVSGYSWGPVKFADATLGGQQIASLPIQVIGDSIFPVPPTSCSNLGASLGSVDALGANGILGVGVFEHDCGLACAQAFPPSIYFGCSNSGCQTVARSLSQQIPNPIARLATDNNGVLIDLPTVASSGATKVNGSLIFGIGTRANNGLGNARVLMLNGSGQFTTLYNNSALSHSFVDSGSNGLFFPDNSIPLCGSSSFYCPASTLTLSAILQSSVTGANIAINFEVANIFTLINDNPTHFAFNNIGGDVGLFTGTFDWGTPFFFGRKVFTAIEGRTTPAGTGPYIAY